MNIQWCKQSISNQRTRLFILKELRDQPYGTISKQSRTRDAEIGSRTKDKKFCSKFTNPPPCSLPPLWISSLYHLINLVELSKRLKFFKKNLHSNSCLFLGHFLLKFFLSTDKGQSKRSNYNRICRRLRQLESSNIIHTDI